VSGGKGKRLYLLDEPATGLSGEDAGGASVDIVLLRNESYER